MQQNCIAKISGGPARQISCWGVPVHFSPWSPGEHGTLQVWILKYLQKEGPAMHGLTGPGWVLRPCVRLLCKNPRILSCNKVPCMNYGNLSSYAMET